MITYRFLLAAHIFANMVWIGSISAVGLMLAANDHVPIRERAKLALRPYRCLAVPAFLASLTVGVACLIMDPSKSILKMPSMHLKLTLALGVIAIHHWIGVVARRSASGRSEAAFPIKAVVFLLIFAGSASLLGVVKPF